MHDIVNDTIIMEDLMEGRRAVEAPRARRHYPARMIAVSDPHAMEASLGVRGNAPILIGVSDAPMFTFTWADLALPEPLWQPQDGAIMADTAIKLLQAVVRMQKWDASTVVTGLLLMAWKPNGTIERVWCRWDRPQCAGTGIVPAAILQATPANPTLPRSTPEEMKRRIKDQAKQAITGR